MDKRRRADLLSNSDLMRKVKDYNALHYNELEQYKKEPNYIVRDFVFPDWFTAFKYYMSLSGSDKLDFDDALKILKSKAQKRWRYQKVIQKWYDDHKSVYFCTFTISDKYINNSLDTNKKRLTKYLNNISDDYICNIDYGGKTDRLHFHGLVCINDLSVLKDPKVKDNKYWYNLVGWDSYTSAVKITSPDSSRVKNYIMKLMNHAVKDTTKDTNIIRKRKRLTSV